MTEPDITDIEPLSPAQREILTRLHRSVLELVNASLGRDLAGTDFAADLRAGQASVIVEMMPTSDRCDVIFYVQSPVLGPKRVKVRELRTGVVGCA